MKERMQRVGRSLTPYLFVAPNIIVFGLFIILPALYNFWLSLFRTSSYSPTTFIGLGNYAYLFTRDDIFWRALRNMGVFVVGDVTLVVVFSVLIGVLLNQNVRWRGFLRSAFFFPVLLSPVVVAMIWSWILNTRFGVLNGILTSIGTKPIPWLLNANSAIFWVVVVNDWATVGFFAIIILAGLQSIPASLYEAAEVDGANQAASFRFITIPLLLPTIMVVLILSLIHAFEMFDYVFVLTGGGPGFATLFMVQYIYRAGFDLNELGLATASSVILFFIILLLTVLQYVMGRMGEAI
jgi:alpha-1,4-digalacturonate transport system permease protein